ncbi:MAG TPA: NAD-binding protein, partial [Candidatus Limnocylindrales bacterium]
YLAEAGAKRADIVAAVTGDDEDNLVICQMAKHHFDVPRTIARVNNPKNEALFKHLGVDELISPTRMILGSIEQDIPVHELLQLATLGEVFALAAVVRDHDRADLVGDLVGPLLVLLQEDHLVAAGDQLLGEVIADFAPTDDENEH